MTARFVPLHGLVGLLVLAAGQIAVLTGSPVAATWLTPIMWTGLILFLDGLLKRLSGRSWLTDRAVEFPLLALISVLVWLLFEAYNLHLRNWAYQGLPNRALLRDIGYFWSFATIMPGVFLVAEIILTLLVRSPRGGEPTIRPGPRWAWFLGGLALVTIPLALPRGAAAYTFGAVWVGFIFLVDAINDAIGLPSLRADLEEGHLKPILAVLLAGFVCGILWETWNYQALRFGGAYWVYLFPQELQITGLRFGQMPLLGLLGFPPFALELLVFFRALRHLLGGDRVFGAHDDHWLGYS